VNVNATGFTEIYGDFIEAWADNVIEPYEADAPLLADAKFKFGELQGGKFHWPMRATNEGGITTTAAQSTAGESGLPYVGARSGNVPDWQIEAPQLDGRSRVKYEAIARSMKTVDGNAADRKKAVRDATSIVVDGLLGAQVKRCEAWMLHGRRGIGQVANNSSIVAASTVAGNELANPFDNNAAGFIVDIEFTTASWMEGIWLQSEGSTFDIFANTSGVPSGTRLNTAANTVLTSGTNQTGLVLTMVNPPTIQAGLANGNTRVCRFFHTSGTAGGAGVGIIGAVTHAQINASAHVCFESGGPTSEYVSLSSMASNTGTLFAVSGATYSVARGNFDTAAGNVKLADLVRRLARPINKGAKGKRIRAVVPTELFAQFANDEATLRRYASQANAKNGFESLEMYLPHKGVLEVLGHTLQKDGEILCYVPKEVIRVGSQDVSMIERGKSKEKFILEVAQSPASEMRSFGQFAPLAAAPCHMMWLGGVTY
jgi:hypothetical protein